MLKRSRAPSPSPSRADPSSPPPLDDNPRLPFPKRRRTVGPVIDSVERGAGATEDDGEDDDDFEYESGEPNMLPPDGKAYEHVNHILHCLHGEHQHRFRPAQPHFVPYFTNQNSHIADPSAFMSSRDSSPSCSSPSSVPAKYYRDSQACSSPMSTQHRVLPPEMEETVSGCSSHARGIPEGMRNKTEQGEDERMRVTQRYEDTNRYGYGVTPR
jgi:hypothetical protein